MNKDDLQQIKTLIEDTFEKHLGAVHEEISTLTENTNALSNEISELRQETRDGFVAVNSKLGGLNNRIDNETFARKDLEHRLRRALPDLPEAARS
jgi:predicted  nucleic acid-binding Zn-ribbon protein